MARNLLLLMVAAAVALAGAEVICRVLVPFAGWRQFEDVGLGWSSREYQRFDPLTEPKREGERRLLFLGDSFIAGAGLAHLDQRFPVRAGERLGGDVSVALLASAGWGTDQQLLAYVQKGRKWQPDVVYLVFCANNDLANILSNDHVGIGTKPYFVRDDTGALQLFTANGDPADFGAHRAQEASGFQSYLLDLIRYQLRERAEQEARDPSDFARVDPRYRRFDLRRENPAELWQGNRLSWSPEAGVNHVSAYIHEDFETNRYQWALFEGILIELERAVQASGARLVVMLLPVSLRARDLRFVVGSDFVQHYETPGGGFTFRAAEPRERLRAITKRVGVDFYDPTAAFIERIEREHLVHRTWPDPRQRHFSEVGHRVLADLLVEFLQTATGAGG